MYKYLYSLVHHSVSPIDVGHSAHASSSSRGFLGFDFFSLAHPLVTTLIDCPGTVSWGDLDMQLQSPVDSRYDLGKLLAKVQFSERDHISANIAATPNAMYLKSHHAIAWVKYLIDTLHRDSQLTTLCRDSQLTYTSGRVVSALQEGLVPFCYSLENKPDGAVLYECQCWQLPIFCLEVDVHSSPYRNSVSKTAVDVLDQFRLLCCFNPNIPECVGFTFPKYSIETFAIRVAAMGKCKQSNECNAAFCYTCQLLSIAKSGDTFIHPYRPCG